MKTITLKIRDKKIFPVFSGRLVAQNVKAYRFVLDPDAEWEGLALTATFEGPGGTKSVPLLCGALEEDIPWEPISAPGWLKISVTGLEETEGNILRRLQTKEMGEELEIFPNGALPGEESAEHTPEFEERVLALAQEAVVSAENVKLAAENGEFDGADGMSAYEVACTDGFEGTVSEWLLSLHGKDGQDGKNGQDGKDGADGKDGVQIDDTAERSDATWSSEKISEVVGQGGGTKPAWKAFADCTWAEISNIAKNFDPSEYWKAGDWKPLTFICAKGQFMVPVVIGGFHHYDVYDVRAYGKKKAALLLLVGGNRLITEQMSPWISGVYEPELGSLPEIFIERQDTNTRGMFKCPNRVAWDGSKYIDVTYNVTTLTTPIEYGPHADYPSSTGTWWPNSGIRHALQSVFDFAEEGFCKDDIVPVEVVTSKYYRPALGNEFHTLTVDKVFLPSETEFWGKQYSSPAIEGEQYEYFRKGSSKFFWGQKLLNLPSVIDGQKYSLWTRSSAQEHLNDVKPTMSFSTRVSNTIYSKGVDENGETVASVGYAYGNSRYDGGYYVFAFCL